MAYVINWSATIAWVGDGVGAMSVPSAQRLQQNSGFSANGGPVLVPGGDSPTTGNISTAATTVGTNIATALNNNIAQIQGFATGGG